MTNSKIQQLKQQYPITVSESSSWEEPDEIVYTIAQQGQKGIIIKSSDVDSCVETVHNSFKNHEED